MLQESVPSLVQCCAAASAAAAGTAAPRHDLPQQRAVAQDLEVHLAEVLLALQHVEHGVGVACVAKAAQRPCDACKLLPVELGKLLTNLVEEGGSTKEL